MPSVLITALPGGGPGGGMRTRTSSGPRSALDVADQSGDNEVLGRARRELRTSRAIVDASELAHALDVDLIEATVPQVGRGAPRRTASSSSRAALRAFQLVAEERRAARAALQREEAGVPTSGSSGPRGGTPPVAWVLRRGRAERASPPSDIFQSPAPPWGHWAFGWAGL